MGYDMNLIEREWWGDAQLLEVEWSLDPQLELPLIFTEDDDGKD